MLACPLDTEERERDLEKPCYCDELCIELGDCCYDYFSRLVKSQFAQDRETLKLTGKFQLIRRFVRNKLALVTNNRSHRH